MATRSGSPLSSEVAKPIQCGPYTKAQFQHTIEGARNVKNVEEIEQLLRDYPAALELYRTGKYKVKVKCEVDVERVILVEKRMVKNKEEPSTNQIVPNVNDDTKKDVENTSPVPNDDRQVAKVTKENLIHTAASSIRLTSNTQPKVDHYRTSSRERAKERSLSLANPSNFNFKRPPIAPPAYFPYNLPQPMINGSFHGYFPPNPSFRTYQTPISFQPVRQQWPSVTPVHLHPALHRRPMSNAHHRARSVDPAGRRNLAPQTPIQPMMCRRAPPPAPAPAPEPKAVTNPEKLSIRQLHEVFLQMNPAGRLQLYVLPEVLQRFAIQTTSDDLISAAQDLQYNPNEPISARRLIHILVKLGKIAKSARPAETAAN